jgi:hypothetical protein
LEINDSKDVALESFQTQILNQNVRFVPFVPLKKCHWFFSFKNYFKLSTKNHIILKRQTGLKSVISRLARPNKYSAKILFIFFTKLIP